MRLFRKIWGDSSFERYAFWILIAVELLMSFTFLGYIHIPPLSVTIAYIPVIIAGALLALQNQRWWVLYSDLQVCTRPQLLTLWRQTWFSRLFSAVFRQAACC